VKTIARSVNIAEFCRDDSSRVAEFLSVHFGNLPAAAWIRQFDRMLWANPNQWRGVPAGWLLETPSREVVGFLGNVAHPYSISGTEVRAAATSAWCVAPAFRSLGLLLAEAFLEQPNVDVLFNTTANAGAADLFRRMGAIPVPPGSFGDALFWIARPKDFAEGAVEHLSGSRFAGNASRFLVGPLLGIADAVRSGFAPGADAGLNASSIVRADSGWDPIWRSWSLQLITGVRTSTQMNWRYSSGSHGLVELRLGEERVGLSSTRICVDGLLKRLRVSDLWLDPARLDLVPKIVRLWRQIAARENCGSVEVCGMGTRWRDALRSTRPHRRRLSSESYFVYARDRDHKEQLARVASWHPTDYDGDTPFSLENPENIQ
jgi:hypothetical protein